MLAAATLFVVVGVRARIEGGLEQSETVLAGGSQPVTVRIMDQVPTFSKIVNGTTVTWPCPARRPNEDEKAYGERCWNAWLAFCAGLPEE